MSSTAQRTFMNHGGVYAGVLQHKYDSGELVPPEKYEWQEYPKMLRRSLGVRSVDKSTIRIRGKDEVPFEWVEDVEEFEELTVNSEAEEERVLNGGKSDAQVEEERQQLYTEAKQRGLNVERSWPLFRLQQALGAAPSIGEVEQLQAQLKVLQTEADLRKQITELQAQLAARPETTDDDATRAQLRALGVEPDGRWGASRLRQELDKATAPAAP